MKTKLQILITLASLLLATSASAGGTQVDSATAKALEGKSFCRKVISDGLFGQPRGERSHCVHFEKGRMTDSASTFFGNPPSNKQYVVKNSVIYTRNDQGKWVFSYNINANATVLQNEKIILRITAG